MKRNKLMEDCRKSITPEIRDIVDRELSKCPYNDFPCIHAHISCNQCQHYHNGVRATGGIPIIDKLYKWIKSTKSHK